MNFIHKVPLAPSKCLSKWIKVDNWDEAWLRVKFTLNCQVFFIFEWPLTKFLRKKIGTYWFFWNKWSVTSVVKNESKVWGSWVISPSIIFSNGNLSPLTDWPSKTSLRPKDINVQVLHTLKENCFCFVLSKNSNQYPALQCKPLVLKYFRNLIKRGPWIILVLGKSCFRQILQYLDIWLSQFFDSFLHYFG